MSVAAIMLIMTPISHASQNYIFSYDGDSPVVEEKMEDEIQSKSDGTYNSGLILWLGGAWKHGVTETHVWSVYGHNQKYHHTSVRGAGGKYGYSGRTKPGVVAQATWERARIGNKAFADVED